MANDINALKALMGDEQFVAAIVAMEDPVDVQRAFAEKGFQFTVDQINEIAAMAFSENTDELSEEQMDAVAGGVLAEIAIVAGGIALFANCMAEYNKYRKEKGKSTIW